VQAAGPVREFQGSVFLDTSFFVFLQKSPWNMMLFGTALVSGSLLLWPLMRRLSSTGAPQVGAIEAVQLINRRDALVLDVRDKADYAAGHIPNARNIPLAELAGRLREIEKFKSRPVVINCQSGMRAASACGVLLKNGFSEVFTLGGGIKGWVEASLPVEK
jgi:rhodanese-related sulfurtransferase